MEETEVPVENKQNESQEEMWLKQKLVREEYLEKLNKWLETARLWQNNVFNGFSCSNQVFSENGIQQQFNTVFGNTFPQANFWNENFQNVLRQRFPNNITVSSNTVTHPNQQPRTFIFIIPPLWKRAVAELMDFLILFMVKMALTFILLESFDIIDMEFYGFESFQKNLENPEVAMPMAVELLTLELLHRFIVCAYEALFLKGTFCSTPGKRYMGLMVISAESLSPVPGRIPETVSATGAASLGWQKSLVRAALKNIFVGLLLPLCVAFYIFPQNRTSYDIMTNSIVVEYHQEFIMYNSAI